MWSVVAEQWKVPPWCFPEMNLLQKNAYRADQREQEAGAHTGSNVSDWQDETCGHTLLVCLVRERQVSLRHANWQIAETLQGAKETELYWILHKGSLHPIMQT